MRSTHFFLFASICLISLNGCFTSSAFTAGYYSDRQTTDKLHAARLYDWGTTKSPYGWEERDPICGVLEVQASSETNPISWYKRTACMKIPSNAGGWVPASGKGEEIPILYADPGTSNVSNNLFLLAKKDRGRPIIEFVQRSSDKPENLLKCELDYPQLFMVRRKWWGYPLALILLPPTVGLDILNFLTVGQLYFFLCGPPMQSTNRCDFTAN